eukprot:SAG31_NODE_954_length_10804_cov_3.240355_13_plen_115_part_00
MVAPKTSAMNSVLLLLICAVGAGLLLAVHLVALCSHRNRFILGAGVGNCYLILSIGAKLLAAACVCYSVWFLQTQLNAEQGQYVARPLSDRNLSPHRRTPFTLALDEPTIRTFA